jgi:enoyl-CoA hydratase/carnithine racemase
MSPPHRIARERHDGVVVIAFDRPEVRNAFDRAMYLAVTEALQDALDDDEVRAVVLCGRGPSFCAGQDLKEMAAIATGADDSVGEPGFQGLLDVLGRFDKPLLAAVHGAGMGLGFSILGHVDLVLVDTTARLQVPFAQMGVPPEAASSVLLPARMGWQRAAEVLLTSRWILADEAVASGVALRVCPEGTALDEALALAASIAAHPGGATRTIKRLLLAGRGDAVAEARAREEASFAALFADPDANPGAGLTAALES